MVPFCLSSCLQLYSVPHEDVQLPAIFECQLATIEKKPILFCLNAALMRNISPFVTTSLLTEKVYII